MNPKDLWILDCVTNFLCENDITSQVVRKILVGKDKDQRLSIISRLSINDKNRIIRVHEENMKKEALAFA